jgi:polysaccharide export outer membrane protein
MEFGQARARAAIAVIAAFVSISAPLLAQGITAPVPAARTFAQPGDQLQIKVWPQQAFGPPVTVSVDPRGTIILPQVGLISVDRIPIFELRDTLKARLSRFIREPEVDVAVLRRVTVNGAVLRPDIYFLDVSATLRDAVARAGGISEVGNPKKVSIVRDGVARRVSNWESKASEETVLQSGDQVLVGRRSWVSINIIPLVSLGLATASFLLSLK